ncbi:MAG: hypothetical protein JWO58_626 [Chitinophagaceae bacterium]|nr:hypothetical protein [Chitinophagaceae bacterium]
MENTVNATLHNLVDIATEKLFSNPRVEEAKEKFNKYVHPKKSSNNTLLYSGLAIAAAAGAAYLIYKNREAIREYASGLLDQINELKANLENEQGASRDV